MKLKLCSPTERYHKRGPHFVLGVAHYYGNPPDVQPTSPVFRRTRPGEMASFEATVANITFGVDETQMIPMQGDRANSNATFL